jgi:hypothetical protein
VRCAPNNALQPTVTRNSQHRQCGTIRVRATAAERWSVGRLFLGREAVIGEWRKLPAPAASPVSLSARSRVSGRENGFGLAAPARPPDSRASSLWHGRWTGAHEPPSPFATCTISLRGTGAGRMRSKSRSVVPRRRHSCAAGNISLQCPSRETRGNEPAAQLSRCSRPLPATRRIASAVQYACGQRRLNAGPLGGFSRVVKR